MKMKQHLLSGDSHKLLRWGSHVPLTKAIIQTFPITGALELGAGINSTPVLFDRLPHVVSVEADLNWINKLINERHITLSNNHQIIHHVVPDTITRGTVREKIPNVTIMEALAFYQSFITPSLNYLFVDCYAGFRLEALRSMHERFDVVTYHDAEPHEDKWYGYSMFKPSPDYIHWVDRTFLANTGLLVHRKFAYLMPAFEAAYQIEAALYADKFNALHDPTFEKLIE